MGLRDSLAGLRDSMEPTPPAPVRTPAAPPAAEMPAAAKVGKRGRPDYEQVKVYLPKLAHKQARRKWEDSTGGNFSDLVESLLAEYLRR